MSQRVVVLALLLGACWTSSQPEAVPLGTSEPQRRTKLREDEAPPPACPRFDVKDPTCISLCPREAPDGWPQCVKWVTEMIAEGFTCPTLNPRQCTGPPPRPVATCPVGGCVTVKTRVVAVQVMSGHLVITMGAGSNQGVTKVWRARVVDSNDLPVPGGEVTLVRIDRAVSVGTVQLTTQQLQQAPYVRLEP